MTITTKSDADAAALRHDREDTFAIIALTLSFALAMLGLVMSDHSFRDAANDDMLSATYGS